jgi:hypothetical protein
MRKTRLVVLIVLGAAFSALLSCCLLVPPYVQFKCYERAVLALGLTVTGTDLERSYRYRIHKGMPLEEVKALLGPGSRGGLPPEPMWGNQFYCWEVSGQRLWVGFRGGRVSDKYFWWPSL